MFSHTTQRQRSQDPNRTMTGKAIISGVHDTMMGSLPHSSCMTQYEQPYGMSVPAAFAQTQKIPQVDPT